MRLSIDFAVSDPTCTQLEETETDQIVHYPMEPALAQVSAGLLAAGTSRSISVATATNLALPTPGALAHGSDEFEAFRTKKKCSSRWLPSESRVRMRI